MAVCIRRGVFETNSSSCHSITLNTSDEVYTAPRHLDVWLDMYCGLEDPLYTFGEKVDYFASLALGKDVPGINDLQLLQKIIDHCRYIDLDEIIQYYQDNSLNSDYYIDIVKRQNLKNVKQYCNALANLGVQKIVLHSVDSTSLYYGVDHESNDDIEFVLDYNDIYESLQNVLIKQCYQINVDYDG